VGLAGGGAPCVGARCRRNAKPPPLADARVSPIRSPLERIFFSTEFGWAYPNIPPDPEATQVKSDRYLALKFELGLLHATKKLC